MPRVALITREIPEPNVAGHLAYMHGILDYLQSKGYKITIVVVSGYLYCKSRGLFEGLPFAIDPDCQARHLSIGGTGLGQVGPDAVAVASARACA